MDRTIYQFNSTNPARLATPAATRVAARAEGGEPRIGVIYNGRSHRNRGQDLAGPHRPGVMIARPDKRADIADALAEFAAQGIDYLIINGGDGTVRDVLSLGQLVFGDHWPQIAVLPKGKTNALNVDLGAPADWNLHDAIAAFDGGKRVVRHPLLIRRKDSDEPGVFGFILGAGVFTTATQSGQDAHQLGFFNSLAVAMTALWTLAQGLFGGDESRWRRGHGMELHLLPNGEPVPHSGHGNPHQRAFLLASTLEQFPAGIRPFGPVRSGLKLIVLDKSRRRLMLSSPLILAGGYYDWIRRAGFHQIDTEGFSIDIEEPFIVDGEAFPPGSYEVGQGPELTFVTP